MAVKNERRINYLKLSDRYKIISQPMKEEKELHRKTVRQTLCPIKKLLRKKKHIQKLAANIKTDHTYSDNALLYT